MPQKDLEKLLENVAELLNEACASTDTVADIARRSGVPRPTISRIKNGTNTRKPSIETLGKIARCLGCVVEVRMKKLKS